MDIARQAGTTDLLARLALGRVESCPFDVRGIQDFRQRIIQADCGLHLDRAPDNRKLSLSISSLFNSSSQRLKTKRLLWAASLRECAWCVRLPRQPAVYHPKRKWRLTEQADPEEYLAKKHMDEAIWKRNYSSLTGWYSWHTGQPQNPPPRPRTCSRSSRPEKGYA